MSWTKLAPIVKTTGRPMASASIVVMKDGTAKISLILSASLKDEFGDPKLCDVSVGEGDTAGAVLVEFAAAGAFEVKNFVHGGARIYLPVPEGWPSQAATNQPCALGEKVRHAAGVVLPDDAPPESIVIKLPVEGWRAEIAQRVRPPSGGSAIRPPDPPPAVGQGGGSKKFDMVEYLSAKGVKISRLAENRYSVDGETLVFGQVLKLVNDRRKAADLDPISITHAW